MIVDRCDRPSFYTKSLTESTKNPAEVKNGSGCKVQQHYLHKQFFLNVDNFHDIINSKVELNLWLPELTGRINDPLRQHEITGRVEVATTQAVMLGLCNPPLLYGNTKSV
jgi:hypothetical protein